MGLYMFYQLKATFKKIPNFHGNMFYQEIYLAQAVISLSLVEDGFCENGPPLSRDPPQWASGVASLSGRFRWNLPAALQWHRPAAPHLPARIWLSGAGPRSQHW